MTREQQRENQENARQAQPQQLGARQEPRYPEQAQPTPQAAPDAYEAKRQDEAQSGTRKQAQEQDVVTQRQAGQAEPGQAAAQQERNPQQAQQEEREYRQQNGEQQPGQEQQQQR